MGQTTRFVSLSFATICSGVLQSSLFSVLLTSPYHVSEASSGCLRVNLSPSEGPIAPLSVPLLRSSTPSIQLAEADTHILALPHTRHIFDKYFTLVKVEILEQKGEEEPKRKEDETKKQKEGKKDKKEGRGKKRKPLASMRGMHGYMGMGCGPAAAQEPVETPSRAGLNSLFSVTNTGSSGGSSYLPPATTAAGTHLHPYTAPSRLFHALQVGLQIRRILAIYNNNTGL
ncbi:hypothetical protein MGYG_01289 [Nannizzia gypsea CBS 118893]|uniref:Uncharacterized protein n=1 Tax=Arthroderma gypseum (strain ATCC MYA-4604 / CBS 118893) TaxID=535722 RepID=E5R005_ARTGP|nr:hypothetical protein MGYG_01289 [Nannizzia gypsea CBS 118893]EFQ98254.1 hypothetical protein MGYG_01289 [Nannizzia gypsea CBS 118893]